jgi:hypothetical protein
MVRDQAPENLCSGMCLAAQEGGRKKKNQEPIHLDHITRGVNRRKKKRGIKDVKH